MLSKEQFNALCESTLHEHKKRNIRRYLLDHWIAIVALIIAIIDLFK